MSNPKDWDSSPDWSGGTKSLSDKSRLVSRDELEGLTSSHREDTTALAENQNVKIDGEVEELL